jgi:hypothetical protein
MLSILLGWFACLPAAAGEVESSGFGAVVIPQPAKPANASACVEPVEIMRRDHMKFLLHQRDATVLEGDRDSKYSLVGCMDCHNATKPAETVVRYPDPQHFCAGCHLYASVKIDCFECHADRSLKQLQQGQLDIPPEIQPPGQPPENQPGSALLSLQTFHQQLGQKMGNTGGE